MDDRQVNELRVRLRVILTGIQKLNNLSAAWVAGKQQVYDEEIPYSAAQKTAIRNRVIAIHTELVTILNGLEALTSNVGTVDENDVSARGWADMLQELWAESNQFYEVMTPTRVNGEWRLVVPKPEATANSLVTFKARALVDIGIMRARVG